MQDTQTLDERKAGPQNNEKEIGEMHAKKELFCRLLSRWQLGEATVCFSSNEMALKSKQH